MELGLFDEIGELTRSLLPSELGELRFRAHRHGVKAWFASQGDRDGKAPRCHYEAQIIARRHLDGRDGRILEIGFHAEEREQEANDRALAHLLEAEDEWREDLGESAQPGPFLGRPDDWRRCSETWIEPDLDDEEAAFEIASRLTDYMAALEPVLRRAR